MARLLVMSHGLLCFLCRSGPGKFPCFSCTCDVQVGMAIFFGTLSVAETVVRVVLE